MPNRVRTHTPGDNPTPNRLTPKHLTRQEFAKRLYRLMLEKGWNQSELGRQSGLPRDAISGYIRAKTTPTPLNLQALATALDLKPEELLPNHIESAIEADDPAFEMRASGAKPGMSWLRVNRLVSTSTAIAVASLLEKDDVLDRA